MRWLWLFLGVFVYFMIKGETMGIVITILLAIVVLPGIKYRRQALSHSKNISSNENSNTRSRRSKTTLLSYLKESEILSRHSPPFKKRAGRNTRTGVSAKEDGDILHEENTPSTREDDYFKKGASYLKQDRNQLEKATQTRSQAKRVRRSRAKKHEDNE